MAIFSNFAISAWNHSLQLARWNLPKSFMSASWIITSLIIFSWESAGEPRETGHNRSARQRRRKVVICELSIKINYIKIYYITINYIKINYIKIKLHYNKIKETKTENKHKTTASAVGFNRLLRRLFLRSLTFYFIQWRWNKPPEKN